MVMLGNTAVQETWLLKNNEFIAGPELALPTAAGCFSKSSWSKEEYVIVGGVYTNFFRPNNAQVQHFTNGSWKLLPPETALSIFLFVLI